MATESGKELYRIFKTVKYYFTMFAGICGAAGVISFVIYPGTGLTAIFGSFALVSILLTKVSEYHINKLLCKEPDLKGDH